MVILIAGACMQLQAMDGKTIGHLVSIPVIEGVGIYSSVRLLQTRQPNATSAAVTNLSLIGINAGIGAYTLFGNSDNYGTLRTIHRVVGFLTSAAAVWLTTSAWLDDDMQSVDKGVSTGYSVMTVVPVIMFSF
jgi:heme A synthase